MSSLKKTHIQKGFHYMHDFVYFALFTLCISGISSYQHIYILSNLLNDCVVFHHKVIPYFI